MNFLVRTAYPTPPEVPSDTEVQSHTPVPISTLEGLIAEESSPSRSTEDDADAQSDGFGDVGSSAPDSNSSNQGKHSDISEDDGWITIPNKELPDNWADAADILQLRSLDRSFIFPGEKMNILVCLSASKQESEIITPFRVAAALSRNGKSSPKVPETIETLNKTPVNLNGVVSSVTEDASRQKVENNGQTIVTPEDDISSTETLLRMECHKQQTKTILASFRNSNFFVRITEADEQLWSKRNIPSSMNSEVVQRRSHSDGQSEKVPKSNAVSVLMDNGSFDGNASGGVARDTVKCYSLVSGDIVVLLEVNVGVGSIKDPVLEVIQFEKYRCSVSAFENPNDSVVRNHEDPCQELLYWLFPLDRTIPSPRPLSPPLSSSISQKLTSASGSQIFNFNHFRSYSMPSLPQGGGPPQVASYSNAKSSFDVEDYDRFSPEHPKKNKDTVNEGLLSFRGVSLEPQRFSARCGLEGMYLPGRRWRRKLEIIQPIEICSFGTECNTEDLLCVQIKNVSPARTPEIIIYLDAISIITEEEASRGGLPLSLPIASIETGNGHSLPDLALRRGEQHSFILKMATRMNKDLRGNSEMVRYSRTDAAASNKHMKSSNTDGMTAVSTVNQFAILVSCRCNYTESKLFFKHSTDWRPRIARDLMISIASEPQNQTDRPNDRAPQLPFKVLTLRATNLTYEDLTFTVLNPEAYISPSVLSLSSTPKTPVDLTAFHDFTGRNRDKNEGTLPNLGLFPVSTKSQREGFDGKPSSSVGKWTAMMADVISSNGSGLTHLWLQSAVPLGCVPARSSTTVKLKLLPLTDGIITLDTLHIAVKEKGVTFIPEHSLKIYATSSIATGIL